VGLLDTTSGVLGAKGTRQYESQVVVVREPKNRPENVALTTAVFLAALVASCLRGAFPITREKRLVHVVESVVGVIKSTDLRWTCGRFAIDDDDGDDEEATSH
jgi:hypothetical protein